MPRVRPRDALKDASSNDAKRARDATRDSARDSARRVAIDDDLASTRVDAREDVRCKAREFVRAFACAVAPKTRSGAWRAIGARVERGEGAKDDARASDGRKVESDNGSGYGGDGDDDLAYANAVEAKANERMMHDERMSAKAREVAIALERAGTERAEGGEGDDVNEDVRACVRVLGALLRNDCLENVCARMGLYENILRATRACAGTRASAEALREANVGNSLGDLLKHWEIYRAQIVPVDKRTQKMATLIEETKNEVDKACGTEPARREPNDTRAAYEAEMRPHALSFVSSFKSHAFKHEAEAPARVNKKRLKRITNEIATLSTSLPVNAESSIFLAVCESNTSLMRALVFPATSTPYANAPFEFDIFLPQDYPVSPPRVKFLTTGGGKVRFNPNLYEDGSVCLSLLGTWNGPGWKPETSSILELLIAIQAFIFVEEPLFNEPGYEKSHEFPHEFADESSDYNHDVRWNTLKYAMLPAVFRATKNLQNTTAKQHDCFASVLQIHFNRKYDAILNHIGFWYTTWKMSAPTVCTELESDEGFKERFLAFRDALSEFTKITFPHNLQRSDSVTS